MSEYEEKLSCRLIVWKMVRFIVYVLAMIGGGFLLSYLLYWWFGVRACMVDCVKEGIDEEACRLEVCDE